MRTLEETRYGFKWGPLRVDRLVSDKKFGYLLLVQTEHQAVELRVTPKGRLIRVDRAHVLPEEVLDDK